MGFQALRIAGFPRIATINLNSSLEERHMNSLMANLYFNLRNVLVRDEGQDLVEYALVVALIAFGAITGMGYLATGLNNAFSGIATTLTSDV
jgi:pilus assembly protein Flp/PilA